MDSLKVTLALALAFVAVVSVQAAPGGAPIYAADYYAPPKYSYSYGVKDALTGDVKSAGETREGDVTKGSYSVLQPDGVLRTVNYISTPHTGFQAEVINSAPAVHAVAKKVVAAPVVADYGHGYGGIGLAKAVAPVAAYGGYGGDYGYSGLGPLAHGGHHGYAAPVAIAKPAAISYTHGVGPVVGAAYGHAAPVAAYGGYGGGLGYAGHAGVGLGYGGGLAY